MGRIAALLVFATAAVFSTGTVQAEAPGPLLPPALAIPAVASSAQAFVPDGFTLANEVTGDLGGAYPGVVQVYENPQGRRAMLVGFRRPNGFEATGWGFVLPCRTCGADLPPDRNLDVRIQGGAIIVVDRSESAAEGTTTQAQLVFRPSDDRRGWLLTTLTQLTVFTKDRRAEQSYIDYRRGDTQDAVGRFDGARFVPDRIDSGRTDARELPLNTLALY
ncbi:hypothetical protein [Pigmentiphaga litoralis]|uniref:hypothetical protein n=1 Tax=Pigmentiphaga litoralis TaxID=516702 RepID=UPI003B436ABB